MDTFKVGDTVHLKSGGPRMTVESVSGSDVTCIWFHEQEAKCQAFPAATLKPYVPPRSGPILVR